MSVNNDYHSGLNREIVTVVERFEVPFTHSRRIRKRTRMDLNAKIVFILNRISGFKSYSEILFYTIFISSSSFAIILIGISRYRSTSNQQTSNFIIELIFTRLHEF